MKQQTVMWTALPNGVANGKLRLSVFVSPRLETNEGGDRPSLSLFPDFLDWPARMAAAQFQVRFGGRPPVAAVRVEPEGGAAARDLYRAMLNAGTYVEPVKLPPLAGRALRSFSVRNVHTHLRQAYQETALDSPTVIPRLSPRRLQSQPAGRFLGQIALPPQERAALRSQLDTQRRAAPDQVLYNPPVEDLTSARTRIAAATPAGAAVPKATASAQAVNFEQVGSFYLADRPARVEIARPLVLAPEMDFHKIVSALGQYPAVLRRIGLVIDLEVPYDSALAGQTTVEVIPAWTSTLETTNVTPRTRCIIGPAQFVAQPRPDSDLDNGMLRLDDEARFEVGQVDVDGAAIKAMNAAEEAQSGDADEEKNAALPSLRSAGIWIARVNRAHQLATYTLPRTEAQNLQLASLSKSQPGKVEDLYADDVVRGYRIDVLDEEDGQWRSLCARQGQYRFKNDTEGVNKQLTLEDEGWVSSAAAESTDEDDDDVYVHETLFTWDGWSMVAPRPMRPLPQKGVPAATGSEYGLNARFTPKPGSLPRLRFGHSYRLRARVVDLAGNSLPAELPDDSLASEAVDYVRHEPIATPVLVPLTDLTKSPGETLDRIVIRSYNDSPDKDEKPSAEASERHVAPPKTSESMAEWHGRFDGPAGMQGDAATYQLIVENDGALGDIEPAEQLELPYLPDPLAIGATIRSVQIDVAPGPEDEVVKIPFTGDWPDVRPFRIRVVERRGAGEGPAFQGLDRRLVLPLPKAEIAEIWLSCHTDEPQVSNLGVYRWTVEGLAAPALRAAPLPAPQGRQLRRQLFTPAEAPAAAQAVNLAPAQTQQLQTLNTAVLKGIHWMVTPYRKITLVHAVQQPLITPNLQSLQALKGMGKTFATLEDKFPISGKSTLKVDVLAEWEEPIDPLSEPTWRTLQGRAHVVELPVQYADEQVVMGSPQEPETPAPGGAGRTFAPRALGVPLMRVRAGEPRPQRAALAPRLATLRILGPRHEFGDTKYRRVKYKAVATTRFREYFPFADEDLSSGKAKITRESPPVAVDVLNSARPLAPKIRYVIPTFGWESQPAADGMTSTRRGGGLRVYLERPWFSSGEGELLGVVLPPATVQLADRVGRGSGGGVPEALKRYVTQTGADPVFRSGAVSPAPAPSEFTLGLETEDGLTLDEVPNARVTVVGHKVQFDPSRQLWFCDIELSPQDAYYPFVRLALARYQPKSVQSATEDCKLSQVVLADFAQLTPDRTAGVKFDAAARMAQVSVTGVGYVAPGTGSEMEASLEVREQSLPAGPLGWAPVPEATVRLTASRLNDRLTAWTGRLPVPGDQPPTRFRVVVKEFERFLADEGEEAATPPTAMMVARAFTNRRLVYADVLGLAPAQGAPDEGDQPF
jgi:hypothetical protein